MDPVMPDALTYIKTKFDLDLTQRRQPIEIPNTNRETLARLFYLLGLTKGVELGVERGKYSEVLLRENPLLQLTCVDAWQAYRGYRDHVDNVKLQRFYEEAQQRLAPFAERTRFIREFSVDAAAQIPDRSLDFVYIDAAHDFANVAADLRAWSPKVRIGGIVAGHDYLKAPLPSLMHVPQVIHGWTDAYQITPWFVLGRQAKVEGELRDDGRSWFYVQPEPVERKGVIKQ